MSLTTSQDEGVFTLLVWNSNGAYQLYQYNAVARKIVVSAQGVWNSPSATIFSSGVFVAESPSSRDGTYEMVISSIATDCPAGVWSATLTASGGKIQTQQFLCLSTNSTTIDITTTAIVATSDESQGICHFAEGVIGVAFFSDSNATVSGQIYCLDQSTGQITIPSMTTASPFDVGSSPAAIITRQNGALIIMEVHTDGYCWNNEFDNKRPEPGLCDSIPRSTPHVLNYNYGTLPRWMNLLENQRMVTPCSEDILHGVYDMGGAPSLTSFLYQENLGIIDAHLGPTGLAAAGHCGSSVYSQDSLIIDGWYLPPLPQ